MLYGMVNKYVLMYSSGELVGLDRSSGGYPYKTDSLRDAELWDSKEEATKYSGMFHREGFTLHVVDSVVLKPTISSPSL